MYTFKVLRNASLIIAFVFFAMGAISGGFDPVFRVLFWVAFYSLIAGGASHATWAITKLHIEKREEEREERKKKIEEQILQPQNVGEATAE